MVSWVVDLLFPFWLFFLRACASTSYSIFLRWATSWGDFLGVAGCAVLGGSTTLVGFTLGGGTTLGGATVSEITRVSSGAGLGGCKSRWVYLPHMVQVLGMVRAPCGSGRGVEVEWGGYRVGADELSTSILS